MSKTTTQAQQSDSRALTPIEDVRRNLGLMSGQFKALFPTTQHVERFVRVVMTAIQQNPKLLEAPRASLYAACMRCAQDGLMPDGKEAALVFYGGNEPSVNYQPMVEGMMKKLRNSGEIVGAPKVHVVKENDEFTYELGDEERIVHRPALTNRGKTTGAYSIVNLKGEKSREYMSVDEVEAIRLRSKAKDSGPWKTDYDEMCRKTVFRRHYKKLPKSTDLDNVLAADDETFVPYAEPGATPVGDQAGAAAPRRSAALDAVARAGGETIEGTATRVPEPTTAPQGQQAQQEQAAQPNKTGGAPKDVL